MPIRKGLGPCGLIPPALLTEPWPPSVSRARDSLEDSAKGRGGEVRRGQRRSARKMFDLAGALAVRGIKTGKKDDLIESYALFLDIAESEHEERFLRHRAPSLHNATTVLLRLPSRPAVMLASRLAVAALKAVVDSGEAAVFEAMRSTATLIEQRQQALSRPVGLRWTLTASALVPVETRGFAMLSTLPGRIEGPWPGVRSALVDFGFNPPESSPIPGSIVASPTARRIAVASA